MSKEIKSLEDRGKTKEFRDFYQRLRIKIKRWAKEGKLANRKGSWSGRLTEYLLILPDLVHLSIKLLSDRDVPGRTKILLGSAMGYLIMPIDVLPDFIPVIGFTDDLVVVVVVLNRVINDKDPLVAEKVIEHWAGDGDILEELKNLMVVVNNLLAQLPAGLAKFLRK